MSRHVKYKLISLLRRATAYLLIAGFVFLVGYLFNHFPILYGLGDALQIVIAGVFLYLGYVGCRLLINPYYLNKNKLPPKEFKLQLQVIINWNDVNFKYNQSVLNDIEDTLSSILYKMQLAECTGRETAIDLSESILFFYTDDIAACRQIITNQLQTMGVSHYSML